MPIDKRSTKTRSNPYKKPKPSKEDGPSNEASSSSSRPRPNHKIPKVEQRNSDSLPGLSKLKGQIRQTKRLLAKDTLEPGLKIQTQRRLTSLEADLATALKRDVEKKNGAKYHMVKFFERQKLLRIIKRIQKKLKEEGKSDKKINKLEEELNDSRIMMNYVLNFPNTEKYISLFPPSSSSIPSKTSETKETKLLLPPLLHPKPSPEELEKEDKPTRRRYEILLEIEALMESGKLSKKPEDQVKKEKITLNANESFKKVVEEKEGDKEEEDDFFESD